MTGSRKHTGTLAFVAVAAIAVALGGCLAGQPGFTEDPAGFWLGIWHGIVSPVSLVVGLFDDGVRVYEQHNTGRWYDFGFLLGVTSFWGANHARMRRRPCPHCRGVIVVA